MEYVNIIPVLQLRKYDLPVESVSRAKVSRYKVRRLAETVEV